MQAVKYKKLIDQKSVETKKTLKRKKATGPKSDSFKAIKQTQIGYTKAIFQLEPHR